MVQNARLPTDLGYVYDLTLTLIQYGADPNVNISTKHDANIEDYEPCADNYSHHSHGAAGGGNGHQLQTHR